MFKKTILLTTILSVLLLSACGIAKETELSPEEARVRAESFINDNFMDPANPITIGSIESDSQTGLYKFPVDLGEGQIIYSYISKDGKKLFPEAYDIAELEQTLNVETGTTTNNTTTTITLEDSASFDSEEKVVIYFFWGEGCPYCETQKNAMESWASKYSGIEIKSYETWSNTSNQAILENLATAYDTTIQGVPMTFIGDKYWVGFADSIQAEMESKISECLKSDCENPGKRIQ